MTTENEPKPTGAPAIVNEHEPWCDPEDCNECGCEAGEFGDEDYDCGAWKCPQCGAVQ